MSNFKNKILITVKILIKKITRKVLSVEKFDVEQDNSILVYFINNETRETYIRDITYVFLNKKIIRGFSNKEAAKIGSTYAKYIFNSMNNEQ